MNFALCILIAFVFTFTAAQPQDFSEYLSSEQHSSENELERFDMSELESILKEVCGFEKMLGEFHFLHGLIEKLNKLCDMVNMI